MSYSGKEMHEPHEGSRPRESSKKSEDPRINDYSGEYLHMFSVIFPEFTPKQISKATEFSVTLARERVKYEDEAQEQADRDPYNPEIYSLNGWYRAMKTKLAECRRNRIHYLVMYALDIDGFKRYDDENSTVVNGNETVTSGNHVQGDKALGLAGKLIKSVLREEDIVARPHGDEYIAVLGNMQHKERIFVAERVRQAIAEMPTLLGTSIPLTASIGVIVIGPELTQRHFKSDEELKEALNQVYAVADDVHYRAAKNAGKNRIGFMDYETGKIQTAFVSVDEFGVPDIRYEDPVFTPQSREPTSTHK